MSENAGRSKTRMQRGVGNETRSRRPILSKAARHFLLSYGSLSALVIIALAFGILAPGFLTARNFLTMLRQVSSVAMLAFGVTFGLILGGLDLSVMGVTGVAGSLVGVLLARGCGNLVAVSCGLAAGMLLGLVNGLVVTRLRVSMFLSGLALSWVARGVDLWVTRFEILYEGIQDNPSFLWLGRGAVGPIPAQALIAGVVFVVTHIIMTRTRVGRNMYAIGGSPDGAAAVGINLNKYRLVGLAVSGLFAAMGGILLTSRQGAAIPRSGEGMWLDAILGAVFGTTVLTGGVPHILGTGVGVLFTGILMNGLTQFAVNQFYQDVIKGVLLISAVGLSAIGGKVLKIELK